MDVKKLNLSFAGCGYLGIYHIGVASCFKVYAPHVLLNKIGCASVGALVASALLCDVPLDIGTSGMLKTVIDARKRALGPFHPGFDILDLVRQGMDGILPADAHIRCNGRLFISVTRFKDSENVLLSQFDSKEDLLQAIVCSCFIPFYCGLIPPKFHGVGYMDGGFSDNQPILDDNTITVAPFCGESDICPQDNSCGWVQISLSRTSIAITPSNLYRFARILFPGSSEALSELCQQGFDDAFRFLQKNNLSTPMRCLSLQTRFMLSDSEALTEIESGYRSEDETSSQDSMESRCMHESVQKAIQETFDKVDSGMINQLFKYRMVKLISYISLPCVLPIEITMSFVSNILLVCLRGTLRVSRHCLFLGVLRMQRVKLQQRILTQPRISKYYPSFKNEVISSLHGLLTLLTQLATKLNKHKHQYYKLSCHMAVTQFDYTPRETMVFTTKTNAEKLSLYSKKSLNNGKTAICHNHEKTSRKELQKSNNYNNVAKMKGQECVISNFKIDLTLDRPMTKSTAKDEFGCDLDTIKAFEKDYESKAIDAATTALDAKLGGIGNEKPATHSADDLKEILSFAKKKEALMTFYYMDENKRVNFTKIFNVGIEPLNGRGINTNKQQDQRVSCDKKICKMDKGLENEVITSERN